jgi:P63C domain
LVSAIIKYFAYQGREVAQQTDIILGAIGLRSLGQKILGFESVQKRTLTQAEIIELCCLPVPSDWQRRFPEEYYTELSRLTGLKSFGNSRPTLWAAKTKELVYDYLPPFVYQEIKRCKAETGSYDKLHQFLADDGLRILEQHQRTLLTLMQASATLGQLKTLLNQSCTGTYQLLLLGK